LNAAIESTASSKKSSAPANDHQFVNVHGWLYRKLLIHNPDFKNYISIPSEILQQSPLTLFLPGRPEVFPDSDPLLCPLPLGKPKYSKPNHIKLVSLKIGCLKKNDDSKSMF
jgi:hypothetical protein